MEGEPDRSIWQAMHAHLCAQQPAMCRQWFEQIEPLGVRDGVLHLRVPERVHQRYLQRECAEQFVEAAQSVTGRLLSVAFLGPEEDPPSRPSPPKTPANNGQAVVPPQPAPVQRRQRDDHEPILNPDYTFAQFVEGPNNRLAKAASRGVADNPGSTYNPLFLHGGVGLGKSHLLQAICSRVLERDPDAVIHYMSCEEFVTRFMEAVQAGEMSDFRRQFRHVDMLVIDDIHFLGKRDRSQEEFFHTFNSLYQTQRQIVLSSDARPDEIPDLEERLVSRFNWGLVARLDPPDYETRGAIVSSKARSRGVELPNEVASFIAARFDSNIRELEGALTSVQISAHLAGRDIDLEIAKQALGEGPAKAPPRITIQSIIEQVAEHFDVTLSSLLSRRRQRSVALPRHVGMYLARQHTRHSLEEIGGYFGGRDHTTVLHAVRTVDKQRGCDETLESAISQIERSLHSATPPSQSA